METAIVELESRDPQQLAKACAYIMEQIHLNHKQFASTQDSFAYNVAGRLVLQLDHIFTNHNNDVIIMFLKLMRGVCLVHRNSRQVFNTDKSLQTLLNSGLQNKSPEIQVASIDTLVSILVKQVETIRRFEQIKGLKVVCDVFKHSKTHTKVKLAIIQFLFFYLIPETKSGKPNRKTTADKQEMLGKYLSNVDGLVRELEMNKPFGDIDLEW